MNVMFLPCSAKCFAVSSSSLSGGIFNEDISNVCKDIQCIEKLKGNKALNKFLGCDGSEDLYNSLKKEIKQLGENNLNKENIEIQKNKQSATGNLKKLADVFFAKQELLALDEIQKAREVINNICKTSNINM